jgi:hypothetical protein
MSVRRTMSLKITRFPGGESPLATGNQSIERVWWGKSKATVFVLAAFLCFPQLIEQMDFQGPESQRWGNIWHRAGSSW